MVQGATSHSGWSSAWDRGRQPYRGRAGAHDLFPHLRGAYLRRRELLGTTPTASLVRTLWRLSEYRRRYAISPTPPAWQRGSRRPGRSLPQAERTAGASTTTGGLGDGSAENYSSLPVEHSTWHCQCHLCVPEQWRNGLRTTCLRRGGGTAGVAYFAVHLRQRPDLPTPPAWPLDLERPARCSPLMVGIAGRAPTASGSRSGNPTAGVSTAIHEITNAASVTTDAGTGINCASLSSGGVACFALTDTGFVGKGITTYAAEGPVVPVGPTNAASVIAGPGTPARYLSQAVWTAGALLVMGWALDSTTTNSTTPGTRQGITNATSMSMGNDETTCVWLPPAE